MYSNSIQEHAVQRLTQLRNKRHPNSLATPQRKRKQFRSRNRGKMGSVPNFQRHLVWQVNWKYAEPNKVMSLSRSLFARCGLTIKVRESKFDCSYFSKRGGMILSGLNWAS